jgi:hypothetical protein
MKSPSEPYKSVFYIYTHFDYNMSMSVKNASPRIDKLRQIINGRQGLLLTSDLAHLNIPRTYLSIMEQNGEIERVSRGYIGLSPRLLRMNCSASSLDIAQRSFRTRQAYTFTT